MRSHALSAALIGLLSATAFAQSAPGGDDKAVRERWRARPEACQEPSYNEYSEEKMAKKRAKAAASISGEDDADAAPDVVDVRAFEAPVNWHKLTRIYPNTWIARLACGFGVSGIDENWHKGLLLGGLRTPERDTGAGSKGLDPRTVLADAVRTHAGDAAHRTLYEAALLHQCFAASEWDAKRSYLKYLWCADALDEVPTAEEVTKAVATIFGNSPWHRANFEYLFAQGLAARAQVTAAFTKQEASFPQMKEVLRDSADAAVAAFRQRHQKYAEIYKLVDPISQRFADDPSAAPPADCSETLLRAREQLGTALHAKGEPGVLMVVAGDPLGYQISVALAYCYLGTHRPAHARMEVENIRGGRSVANEREAAHVARIDAIAALEVKLGIHNDRDHAEHEKLVKVVPSLWGYQSMDEVVPESIVSTSIVINDVYKAPVRLAGDEHRYPLIVAAMKHDGDKVMLTFKKTTTPWQELSCHDTDKIDRIDYSGSSGRVVYQRDCKGVGPIKQMPHQEPGFAISAVDAKHVAIGNEILAYVADDVGDGAVMSVYPAGQPKQASVIGGVVVGK